MPNQRVVVLTDEEIKLAWRAIRYYVQVPLLAKLNAAPEGITDDMVERGKEAFAREAVKTHASMSQLDSENDLVVRSILEAALFPGDGEL